MKLNPAILLLLVVSMLIMVACQPAATPEDVLTAEAQAEETSIAEFATEQAIGEATASAEAAAAATGQAAAAGTATAVEGTEIAAEETALWAAVEASETAGAANTATAAAITPTATATPPGATDLTIQDETGDGFDCLSGVAVNEGMRPEVDVQQANFSSNANNMIIQLGFATETDLASAVPGSNLLWGAVVGINNPQNPLPPDDPNKYGDSFENQGFGFYWFVNPSPIISQGYQYVNGQWSQTDNPTGVAAQFGGFTFTMAISSTVLPQQGALHLIISSDNRICDDVGANEQGAVVSFLFDPQEFTTYIWSLSPPVAAPTPEGTPTP
ncbi:MAG: hypothetical protein L0332_22500 [Chloroflexi bacterium]|nr:hypothetical protein [Chloroflexota bacterium]MCI0649664.1 hypothetical protein [Chloroflexota bacterium]MCI0729465.1 hypothetical protein [Chloroflexota bacterium]